MKTTKKICSFSLGVALLGTLFLISSCKKEAGPAGPAGTNGKDGNANVILYKFAGNDFSVNSDVIRNITMTEDSFNKYTWLAYLLYNGSLTYQVPGFCANGSSEYRFYTETKPGVSQAINIKKVSGSGEIYDSVKIVGINISKIYGKKDPVDYSDYKAVCKYYGLPE